MIWRKLAWTLLKNDTQTCEAFYILRIRGIKFCERMVVVAAQQCELYLMPLSCILSGENGKFCVICILPQ